MAAIGGANKRRKKKAKSKPIHRKPKKALLNRRRHHLAKLIPLLISATSAAHSFVLRHDLGLLPAQALSLESLLSSTSLSVSRLFSLLRLPLPPPLPSPHPSHPSPPHCWFDRFLIAAADDYDPRWANFFNLSKPSFTLLLRLLTPSISSLSPLPPNYALAAALFRLAHGSSYSAVARRFGVDSATACRAFYVVCKAINDNLGHLFEFKSDINRVIVGFGWISLPNCCGVLGLEKFEMDSGELGENKSLMVQALVDSEARFLDVSAGWPSSMGPDAVLRQSKIFSGVEESKEYLDGPSFQLIDGTRIPQYVVGDAHFPLLPWLLTPYDNRDEGNELTASECAFNSIHRNAMELIRTAFGRVRSRWKLVTKKWKDPMTEAFPFVIVSCCLLHNFLIKCSEVVLDEDIEHLSDQDYLFYDGEVDEFGKRIRDALATHLSWVSQRM